MNKNHFAEKNYFVVVIEVFSFFAIVEYNGGGFLRCGIQQKRFPPLWNTTERFSVWTHF
jgi:hypothetical protein